MLLLLQVILFVINVAFISATNVDDCENGVPMPIFVQVNDCTDQPCPFPAHTTARANVTFDIPYNMEVLQYEVDAQIVGWIPSDKGDACKSLSPGYFCPLEEGERITFLYGLPMDSYPSIIITLRMQLLTKSAEGKIVPLVCYKFKAQITD